LVTEKIEPTYVGNNENLVLFESKELYTMKMTPEMKDNPEVVKELVKYFRGAMKGLKKGKKTKLGNGNNNKTDTTHEFWDNFESKARSLGIDIIGYTPVNENYIFKDQEVYGKNAIILGMEMKWDWIKKAQLTQFQSFLKS